MDECVGNIRQNDEMARRVNWLFQNDPDMSEHTHILAKMPYAETTYRRFMRPNIRDEIFLAICRNRLDTVRINWLLPIGDAAFVEGVRITYERNDWALRDHLLQLGQGDLISYEQRDAWMAEYAKL